MSECDPVDFPSLLCLRPSHCGREHQASDEVSPPHGIPPLLERIVTFRAIEWERRNAHGSDGRGGLGPQTSNVLGADEPEN
jgi:hypothetical protein